MPYECGFVKDIIAIGSRCSQWVEAGFFTFDWRSCPCVGVAEASNLAKL